MSAWAACGAVGTCVLVSCQRQASPSPLFKETLASFPRREASTIVRYENVFKLTVIWRCFFLDKFLCLCFPALCAETRQRCNSYLLSALFDLILWKPFFKGRSQAFEWGHRVISAVLDGQHKNDRSHETKCSGNRLQQLGCEKLCSRHHINMTEGSCVV